VTPVSFEQARAIVAAEVGRTPAMWGWENADVFVIGFDYPPGEAPLGEETAVVVKATGQLRWEFSPPGEPVAPGLQLIANPPKSNHCTDYQSG